MCVLSVPARSGSGFCRLYLSVPQPFQIVSNGHCVEHCPIPQVLDEDAGLKKLVESEHSVIENQPNNEEFAALTNYPVPLDCVYNFVSIPIKTTRNASRVVGAIQVFNKQCREAFTPTDIDALGEAVETINTVIESALISSDMVELSNQVPLHSGENEVRPVNNIKFYAASEGMRGLTSQVEQLSNLPVNIHICGENGTGKELIARMIHERGDRASEPFVAVNCAAIPDNLVESEFFGYEKGAFTGANASRGGLLEQAGGGTLFLDEVAEMPMSMQAKLLRVLQENEGARLGSNRIMKYDFRLVSACNRDLKEEVAKGAFREDLFYRLFSVQLRIPPLRERKEDIIVMGLAFLQEVSAKFNKQLAGFAPNTLRLFERYPWPGNVRQFRHEIERLVALTPEGHTITPEMCSSEILDYARQRPRSPEPSEQSELALPHAVTCLEIRLIEKALKATNGNKVQAAKLLNITRQGLHKKIQRYQIETAGNDKTH